MSGFRRVVIYTHLFCERYLLVSYKAASHASLLPNYEAGALMILSAFLRACASSARGVGAALAGIFLLGLYCIGWSLRRRIRRKWGIPSPRCAYGLEALDFCCWCAGCDDCCCMLWCGPCALDQLARQEYLASNGYSVEYDFYAPTGVVHGVQYARPPV